MVGISLVDEYTNLVTSSTDLIAIDKLESVLKKSLKRKEMVEKNISVIRKAAEFVK